MSKGNKRKDPSYFPIFDMKSVEICLFLSFKKRKIIFLKKTKIRIHISKLPETKHATSPFPPSTIHRVHRVLQKKLFFQEPVWEELLVSQNVLSFKKLALFL